MSAHELQRAPLSITLSENCVRAEYCNPYEDDLEIRRADHEHERGCGDHGGGNGGRDQAHCGSQQGGYRYALGGESFFKYLRRRPPTTSCRSEKELDGKLEFARLLGSEDLPESRRSEHSAGKIEVRPVEQVERLRPEL